MLDTLRIRNLALVTDLTLELGAGYNAIVANRARASPFPSVR